MKIKTLAAAAALVLAAPAFAAIAPGLSGNGELFLNVYDSATQVSYAFDTGVFMDDFFAQGQAESGAQLSFGVAALPLYQTFRSLAVTSNLRWSVVAIDSTGSTAPGLQRLFSTVKTGDEAKVANQTNGNFTNGIGASQGGRFFDTVNSPNLQLAGQSTHVVVAADQVNFAINGNSYSQSTDAGFGYYGKSGGLTPTYNGTATYNAGNPLNVAASFDYVTRSGSTGINKVLVDVFNNSQNTGTWSFDGSTLQYNLTAAVPEPETYALMLAGLGGLLMMARRRRSA